MLALWAAIPIAVLPATSNEVPAEAVRQAEAALRSAMPKPFEPAGLDLAVLASHLVAAGPACRADGKLRRAYLRSVVHGTAVAYRIVNAETHLVTNEHVANQPEVTDDEHPVEGVPTGSKKRNGAASPLIWVSPTWSSPRLPVACCAWDLWMSPDMSVSFATCWPAPAAWICCCS